MLTIAYYFLQVALCSGFLMGYYWLVLRNKRFHQYNRFYLLAAAVLSWIVPLVKITWNQPEVDNAPQGVITFLTAVATNNTFIDNQVSRTGSQWNWNAWASGIYMAVSLVLLAVLVQAFVKLYRLLKQHSCRNVGDVYLILTQAKGTPFSFFRYIFWNEEIDIRSEAGQQILQHELTHVRQKHSFDKLFIQLMMVVGWFNPFFWLLRREMDMIHEFIADKKAVTDGDTAALAQMLLTAAYPQQKFILTHPFFFSPIKRRLLMLGNKKNPRFSYIRRLVVLPLLAIVTVLFAFRSQDQRAGGELSVASVVDNYREDIKEVFAGEAEQQPLAESFVTPLLYNGKRVDAAIERVSDLEYAPYLLEQREKQLPSDTTPILHLRANNLPTAPKPLFVVNGQKATDDALSSVNADMLESIHVLKGKDAIDTYGPEAANGVILINLKPAAKAGITFTYDEGRHAFPNLSAMVRDAFDNPSKERKVFVKEIIYQGEEKTKVIEETHATTTNADGIFLIKIGSGTLSASSKKPEEIDLSKGPFYVNVKVAIAPSNPDAYWKPEDNFVDLGFSLLALKENKFLSQQPNGNVTWGEPKGVRGAAADKTVSDIVRVTAKGVPANPSAASQQVQDDATLNEVVVIGYNSTPAGGVNQLQLSTPASFPGGNAGWEKYLMQNLNRDILKKNKAPFGKYTVEVSFLVSKDGAISDVRAVNDAGYGTAAEAERIIAKGPKWVPAKNTSGQAVSYRQKQPISFVYVDESKAQATAMKVESVPANVHVYGGTIAAAPAGELTSSTIKAESVKLNLSGVVTGGVFSGTLAQGQGIATPPEFPGGAAAWNRYVESTLDKNEPVSKGAPSGRYTVVVRFIVGVDGGLSGISAENDPGYGIKEQALRLLQKAPHWIPASINDRPMAMVHRVSISLVVSNGKGALGKLSFRSNLSVPGKAFIVEPNLSRLLTMRLKEKSKATPSS